MKRTTLVFLSIFSGALAALAIPNELFPYGNSAAGWIVAAPLFLALSASPSLRFSALLGALYGAAAHGFSSYWLWNFKDFAVWTLGSTVFAYALIYAHLALWFDFILRRGGICRVFAFALLWAGFEFYKSTGFLGYPWGLLAYSVNTQLPLIQMADRTGVYGISFLLAWSGASLGEILSARTTNPRETFGLPSGGLGWFPGLPSPGLDRAALGIGNLAMTALSVTAALSYGFYRMNVPVPEKGRFTAVLVQQNSDSWTDGEEHTLLACMDLTKKAISQAGTTPDIVLWNESNLDRPYNDFLKKYSRYPAGSPLVPFFKETGTRFFLGAPIILDWDTYDAMNSVILIGPEGFQEAYYGKIQLVPFAESIPFWEIEWFRNFIKNTVGLSAGGWTAGAEHVLFRLPAEGQEPFDFAGPICFEDAFAGLCRDFALKGADFFVNLTNDSWSRTVSAEMQHFVAARFRSVETRRTLVRSTNGGFSCVLGAYGEILESLPIFFPVSRFVEIPVLREAGETVYTRYGDWFGLGALFISGGFVLILVLEDTISNRRKKREHSRLSGE